MSESTLLLGPIALQEFEIPEVVSFGGRQNLAVHQLIGGGRVIDALGRNDSIISFRGIFSGPGATSRASAIDELRVAGQPLPMIWNVFYYTVVISRFHADFRNPWWIPFGIWCTVLRDEASTPIMAAVPLVNSLTADVLSAVGMASLGGFDLSDQQTIISVPNVSVRGSGAFSNACAVLAAGCAGIASARDAAGFDVEADFSTIVNGGTASIGALASAEAAAQQLASLTAAGAYLGRASINLANAST